MPETLTAQQRLDRAAEAARADEQARIDREVEKARAKEQRRIDAEARREREAEQMAHYRSEFATEYGIDHLPREVVDLVWNLAWQEGHSSGYGQVEHYYGEYAPMVLAAFEAGQKA